MAIAPHSSKPHLDRPALRVVRLSGAALTEGIEPIGVEVALEALRDGWSQRKLSISWVTQTVAFRTNDAQNEHAIQRRSTNSKRP